MFAALRLRCADFAKNWGEKNEAESDTETRESIESEDNGKTRVKFLENVRETRTIVPVGFGMEVG